MILLITALTVILTAVLYLADNGPDHKRLQKLSRNSYGDGSKTEEIMVTAEDDIEEEPLKVEIDERQYTPSELKEVFDKSVKKLDTLILGANKSLDCINEDMQLLTNIPGESIEVAWELSRYDVMDAQGKLHREALKEEGTLVELKAVLIYTQDEERKAEYKTSVMIYPEEKSGKDLLMEQIKRAIETNETGSRTYKSVELPDHVNGKKITYKKKADQRSLAAAFLGVLAVILFVLKEKDEVKKERIKRKKQMMLDYPEIVDKLTLLISAGMTVKNAWFRIAEEYRQKKTVHKTRYAYEEMETACYEMKSGISEMESYERFAERCDLQAYLKLGALLSQNLRKGNRGLAELLQAEAAQAFEERKALAKRQGEEAGTKLLLPMFFMLGVVLIIVIVPAFMSVRM